MHPRGCYGNSAAREEITSNASGCDLVLALALLWKAHHRRILVQTRAGGLGIWSIDPFTFISERGGAPASLREPARG